MVQQITRMRKKEKGSEMYATKSLNLNMALLCRRSGGSFLSKISTVSSQFGRDRGVRRRYEYTGMA